MTELSRVIVGVLLCGLLAGCSGSGSSPPTEPTVLSSATAVVPTPRPTVPAPPLDTAISLKNNQGVSFSITVNSITNPAHSTDPYYENMGRWILVDYTVTNEADRKLDFYSDYLRLLSDDGTEVTHGNLGGFPKPGLPPFPSLASGEVIRGNQVYLVPKNSREKALIYHQSGIDVRVLANFGP